VRIPFSEGSRRYNIAPTQTVIAIVRGEDGTPEARAMRWGLIPPWAKDAKIAYKMIKGRDG
jgi:putative SOS response-associated peptidase YedK